MEITKKILNIALIVVTAFMTLMSCVYVYYVTIGKHKIPTAVTSTYATTITDPQTGENKPVLEANYYANKNGKGYEVVELLFNCYSGYGKQAIYSRGFQLVKDKQGNIVPYVFSEQKENVYQYNRYDNQNFETGHNYSWGDPMLIDINDKLYAVRLDGKYTIHHKEFNLGGTVWNGIKNTLTLHWGRDPMAYDEWDETFEYTFQDLLEKVARIMKSCSNGTGDSVISLIDLGDFLHIYAVDENGQISGEPLGVNTLQNSYFTMATHFDNRGMVWAKQSMFKSVAGNADFNISGISESVDYWKVKTTYNLTEKDFSERYMQSENGFYYGLSTEKINEIKSYEDIEINIEFNVSNLKDRNVLGFDYYALYGIKVNSLSIKANSERDFRLLVGSLKDTGITNIETQNVRLVNINSGVEL